MNRVLLLLLSVLPLQLFGNNVLPTNSPEKPPSSFISSSENNPELAHEWLMDTVPPVITCPVLDTVSLPIGDCDTTVFFTVTATDDQGPAIVVQLSGPVSGSDFSAGTSICVFLATDLASNTATCSFSITVQDTAVIALVCNDVYVIKLDSNCTKTMLPGEFLEGGPYGCPARYVAEVDRTIPFGNGPWMPATYDVDDLGKTYQSRITDLSTGNKCWGNVRIEDQLPPVFKCQNLTVSCAEENFDPLFLENTLGLIHASPEVSDACSAVTAPTFVDLSDVTNNCDSTFARVITRRWQAADQNGNTSTCLQRINLRHHSIPDMQVPADITLNCPNTDVDPSLTGLPFVMDNGKRYTTVNNSICDLSVFYEDFPLTLSCGDIRVRRLWEFFDFCTNTTEGPFLQNIYILDESKPTVACPASLVVTVSADTCYGLVDLPDAVLNDACSEIVVFQAFWEDNGLSKTLFGSLSDYVGNDDSTEFDTLGVMGTALFPMGTTEVTYVAEDSCGNIGDCVFMLTVADMVPPVALCDTFSTVQLLADGTAAVGAADFDNGSDDACTPIHFKARFLETTLCLFDSTWTDSLRFCCLDQSDTLDALIRVYDIPVPSGNVLDSFGAGHFSDCAVKIVVTDPNPPLCTAPQNLTVSCETFDPTLEIYGDITSTSCGVDSLSMELDYTQFDSACNRGVITRIFKVYDTAGNVGGCAQAITVTYDEGYFIKFPDDLVLNTCDSSYSFGEPTFLLNGCENMKVTYTDQIFTVVPDACFRIERTWRIINECTYVDTLPLINVPNPTPNSTNNHLSNLPGPVVSAPGTAGTWASTTVRINPTDPQPTNFAIFYKADANGYRYSQIIKIIESEKPFGTKTTPTCANQNWKTTNNPQFWNETYWNDQVLGINDLAEEPTELSLVASDLCSRSIVDVNYLLFLDLDGDNETETVINSTQLANIGWNNVPFNNKGNPNYSGGTPRQFDERPVPANQKMGFAIEKTVSGNNKIASVRWNTQQNPNAYFLPEFPLGTHEIRWTITDGCGNSSVVNDTFTVKDCKPPTVVCKDTQRVQLLQAGFWNMNATDLLELSEDNYAPDAHIERSLRFCGDGNGFPVNQDGTPVTSITFTCDDLYDHCLEVWARDPAGNTEFCQVHVIVQDSADYCSVLFDNISGEITTEAGEGVSDVSIELRNMCPTCPPFLASQTTNGDGYFEIFDPIPMAANTTIVPEKDDNPTNGVTTFDLVLISKHILGTEPLNSPYKIISADANRGGSVTSFDIVEFRKLILGIYTELPNNTSWRFVDSSFVFPNPNQPFLPGFPDTIRIDQPKPYKFIGMKVGDLNLTALPNAQGAATERFEGTVFLDTEDRLVEAGEVFDLKFKTSERLEGCQFTLENQDLEIMKILPEAGLGRENFALFPEKSMLTMSWESGGEASFSLRMKAQKSGPLREMLRLSDKITPAEAYKNTVQPLVKQRLALRFGQPGSGFELLQNQPNPFEQKTFITFQLPEASTAVLKVLDATGKLLWSTSGDWTAGLHTVEVDLSQITAAGVLYYQLESATHSATRKMVRL